MRPSAYQVNVIYQRLLAHEADAPGDFIELLLDPLIEELRRRFPALPLPDLITDVVTDTLLAFVQSPNSYQMERGDLWKYLLMDAWGDLLNEWDKEQRRRAKEVPFNLVAHDRSDRNSNVVEEEVMQRLGMTFLPEGMDAQTAVSHLYIAIPDPRDRQVLLLMYNGERRTSAFAAVLGIEHLPIEVQRQRVKQVKDRLRLRVKRYGGKIHELQ
jgi:RNA polymerase sigma-70 factor (ECF subfamily)